MLDCYVSLYFLWYLTYPRQMTDTHTQPLSKDKKEDPSLPSLQKIKSSKLFVKGASGTWPRALRRRSTK